MDYFEDDDDDTRGGGFAILVFIIIIFTIGSLFTSKCSAPDGKREFLNRYSLNVD